MRLHVVFLLLLSGATGLALSAVGTAAAQDAVAGEKTFNVCRACHQIGANAKNSIGPVLNGVVGRKSGAYPEYAYSDANRNSGLTWDEPTLKEYLKNPMAKVPGTKMAYPGLRKDEDIENVIAFLKQYGPNGTLGEAASPAGVPRPPL